MSRQRTRAACEDQDPELFFPVGTSGPALLQTEMAKGVCRGCPLQVECLADALARGIDFGIWGGYDEYERRAMRRRGNVEARSKDADHRDRTSLVRELASTP